MAVPGGTRIDLARVAQLDAQLRDDASMPGDAAFERDRAIAAAHDLPRDRLGRLSAWLDHASGDFAKAAATYVDKVNAATTLAIIVIGLMLGGSAAAALLAYDGTHPINVTWIVIVFGGAQLVIVLLTLAAMLSQRVSMPSDLRKALTALSPGWLAVKAGIRRIIPDDKRQAIEPVFDHFVGRTAVYGQLGRWWILRQGQLLGTTFNLSAIAVALLLILTRNLAFGWESTFFDASRDPTPVFTAIAVPWAWAWPDAAPDAELIKATEIVLAKDHVDTTPSAMRRAWWRFVLMVIVVYGLLPRVVLLAVAQWRLGVTARSTFANMPDASIVLAHLDAPRDAPPGQTLEDADGDEPAAWSASAPLVIAWAKPPAVASLAVDMEANGTTSAAAGAELAQQASPDRPLLIITCGWEPPLAELFDFVAELRAATSKTQPIHLLPVGLGEGERAVDATDAQIAMWRRRAAAERDPWISVRKLSEVAP